MLSEDGHVLRAEIRQDGREANALHVLELVVGVLHQAVEIASGRSTPKPAVTLSPSPKSSTLRLVQGLANASRGTHRSGRSAADGLRVEGVIAESAPASAASANRSRPIRNSDVVSSNSQQKRIDRVLCGPVMPISGLQLRSRRRATTTKAMVTPTAALRLTRPLLGPKSEIGAEAVPRIQSSGDGRNAEERPVASASRRVEG